MYRQNLKELPRILESHLGGKLRRFEYTHDKRLMMLNEVEHRISDTRSLIGSSIQNGYRLSISFK